MSQSGIGVPHDLILVVSRLDDVIWYSQVQSTVPTTSFTVHRTGSRSRHRSRDVNDIHGYMVISVKQVQRIYRTVRWSTIPVCINFQTQQLNFRINSNFSSFRHRVDWHVFLLPVLRQTIGVTSYRLTQDLVGPLRRMTTFNESESNCPPAVGNADTYDEPKEDSLDGLEHEFQKAVKLVSDETDHSGKNIDAQDAVLPTENVVTSEVTNAPTNIAVDNLKVSKTLRRIASLIDKATNILILSGAGVSVAAGIPDFRTPGTGLYDNLQKYDLPYAQAVFDIQYYQINPKPFVQLAAELWPDRHVPTITHSFIALLVDKQRLLRNYTQVRFD